MPTSKDGRVPQPIEIIAYSLSSCDCLDLGLVTFLCLSLSKSNSLIINSFPSLSLTFIVGSFMVFTLIKNKGQLSPLRVNPLSN